MIDFTSDFGRRVAQRLQDEEIIWLTTISNQGIPQPNPVWFYWDGESMLIYSKFDAFRNRHIERRPNVALHFNSGPRGNDIVVFAGQATIDQNAPPANEIQPFVEKYREGLVRIQMSAERFAEVYSVAINIVPTKLRGF